ncbi:hypothetical protein [Methylomonas sp. AM2-LC]|uniref:hypothetical protein n=1 Tax=Methylomonas sp. AM2-LC TaxID=3153301 RepID=UPI003267E150
MKSLFSTSLIARYFQTALGFLILNAIAHNDMARQPFYHIIDKPVFWIGYLIFCVAMVLIIHGSYSAQKNYVEQMNAGQY